MALFRSAVFAACLLSCGVVEMGEPVSCEHDATCGSGFVCELYICVQAIECTADSSCPVGSSCIDRPDDAPDNVFEVESRGKSVCDCLNECGTGGFNAGGAATGGQGGEPAGGQGGEPAGGQGGEPAGGQGGEPAGGQGGAR